MPTKEGLPCDCDGKCLVHKLTEEQRSLLTAQELAIFDHELESARRKEEAGRVYKEAAQAKAKADKMYQALKTPASIAHEAYAQAHLMCRSIMQSLAKRSAAKPPIPPSQPPAEEE